MSMKWLEWSEAKLYLSLKKKSIAFHLPWINQNTYCTNIMSLYSLFSLFQLASPLKTPQAINISIGMFRCFLHCMFLCVSSICEIDQKTFTKFHWVSIPHQPPPRECNFILPFRQAAWSLFAWERSQWTFSLDFWATFLGLPICTFCL